MIGKYIRLVFSLPKSFYMNFRWLPFKKAIKFPIMISFDASLRGGGQNCFTGTGKIRNGSYRIS